MAHLIKLLIISSTMLTNTFLLNSAEKPIPIVNYNGTCYLNATLQTLFSLNFFNEKIKQVSINPDKFPYLSDYKKNLILFLKEQTEAQVKNISLIGKLRNKENEPTQIIQQILADFLSLKEEFKEIFKMIIVPQKKYWSIQKNIRYSAISEKYMIVILDNPLDDILPKKKSSNLQDFNPQLLITRYETIYQLKSVIMACSSSDINEHNDSESESFSDNFGTSQSLKGSNHSITYVRYEENYYLCSDKFIRKDRSQELSQTLIGKNTSFLINSSTYISRLIPGVLIYEKVEV